MVGGTEKYASNAMEAGTTKDGLVVLAGSHDGARANCETVGSETAQRFVEDRQM